MPLTIKSFEQSGRDLYTSDISEVIASCPESDNEASVLFGEPISHDRNEAWKQEGVEDTDEDLHEVVIALISPIEKAWKR